MHTFAQKKTSTPQTNSVATRTSQGFRSPNPVAVSINHSIQTAGYGTTQRMEKTNGLVSLIQQGSESNPLQRAPSRPFPDRDRWEKGCREWDELPRERDKEKEADRAKMVANYYVRQVLNEEPADEGYGTNPRRGDCWVKHGNNPDGTARLINVYLHPIRKPGEVKVFLPNRKSCILEYSCPSGASSIKFKIKECTDH